MSAEKWDISFPTSDQNTSAINKHNEAQQKYAFMHLV